MAWVALYGTDMYLVLLFQDVNLNFPLAHIFQMEAIRRFFKRHCYFDKLVVFIN